MNSGTGAANAASRIHRSLCLLGMNSRMFVSYNTMPASDVNEIRRSIAYRASEKVRSIVENWMLQRDSSDYVLSTGFVGHDISKIVRSEQPDVLQLHWIGGHSFRFSSLRNVKIPVVWRMPDMWSFCGVEHLSENSAGYIDGYSSSKRLDRKSIFDVDRIAWRNKMRVYESLERLVFVSPSQWLAKCAASSKLLKNKRIEVVPTSCEVNLFSPKNKEACRQVLGLDSDARVVLTGATCMKTRWKGSDLLVSALNQLANDSGLKCQVVCFGQGGETLQQQCRLPVVSMGGISDPRLLTLLYSAADTFVAPSRMENLPNTVLESMSCGTPAVAFNIGGMPDIIEHQKNGYLAEPYSTNDLAEGIRWILQDTGAAGAGKAAREKILLNHQPENEARAYLKIYESLLQN